MEDDLYEVIVNTIEPNGKHGPYAVAHDKDLGPISFALTKPVWEEEERPELGTYVILSKLTKKRAGWRANHGRFLRPSDERRKRKE